jgi:hypothetical protein
MIRTTARMVTTLELDAETLLWAVDGTVISDGAARTIAAGWQSPGTVGHVLATLASGLPVELEELRADLDATRRQDRPGLFGARELDALEWWAIVRAGEE